MTKPLHKNSVLLIRLAIGLLTAALMMAPIVESAAAAPNEQRRPMPRTPLTSSEVAKKASPSVVTVRTPGGFGSGVLLDPNGVLVTSLHVIKGESTVSVKLPNGDIYDDVSVVDFDERKDLVLLRIKAFALVPAVVGNSDSVLVGDRIVLIGSPQGLERSVSDGLISAIRDSGDGYRLFQTSAAASPGSSGGGMFNQYGELVGIVTAKLTTGENLNFGIPINYVRGLQSRESRMTLEELATRLGSPKPSNAAASTVAAGPSTTSETIEKLGAIVRNSGLELSKSGDASWAVSYKGEHLEKVTVYVSAVADLAVIQSVVARDVRLTPTQLTGLLQVNFDRDLVKVSLQEGKHLVALYETDLRTLDGPALKRIVLAVATCADDVAARLSSSVASPEIADKDLTSEPGIGRVAALALLQGHAQIRFDPSVWIPEKTEEEGTFQYRNRKNELWMKVITERIPVSLEKMPDIAITNARSVAPDAKITRRGYRNVNGARTLFLEFQGTADGIVFAFYGHYYSDSSGTIQIIGWTAANLMSEYRGAVESVVSSLSVTRH